MLKIAREFLLFVYCAGALAGIVFAAVYVGIAPWLVAILWGLPLGWITALVIRNDKSGTPVTSALLQNLPSPDGSSNDLFRMVYAWTLEIIGVAVIVIAVWITNFLGYDFPWGWGLLVLGASWLGQWIELPFEPRAIPWHAVITIAVPFGAASFGFIRAFDSGRWDEIGTIAIASAIFWLTGSATGWNARRHYESGSPIDEEPGCFTASCIVGGIAVVQVFLKATSGLDYSVRPSMLALVAAFLAAYWLQSRSTHCAKHPPNHSNPTPTTHPASNGAVGDP